MKQPEGTDSKKPDTIMDEESQRFMAFEGLRTWCVTALKQIERMNIARKERDDESPSFNCEKHLFLIAAWKVVEHVDWVKKLNFVDDHKLTDFGQMREPLKTMRDKNEHVIEYFKSEGRYPDDWWYTMPGGVCDASATVGTLIGGRADWALIKSDIEKMLAALPKHYWPARDGRAGIFTS
jgi:hypothetical protein